MVYLCPVFLSQCNSSPLSKGEDLFLLILLLIFSIISVLELVRHFSGTLQLCNLEKSIFFLLLEQVTAGLEIWIGLLLSLASTSSRNGCVWKGEKSERTGWSTISAQKCQWCIRLCPVWTTEMNSDCYFKHSLSWCKLSLLLQAKGLFGCLFPKAQFPYFLPLLCQHSNI